MRKSHLDLRMSDTCIVCLGDLSTGIDGDAAQSTTIAKSPLRDAAADGVPIPTGTVAALNSTTENDSTPELVAHIQPCGHDLHNACLTPWVERANSCPICRATFNLVELMHHVGGEVISSYTVRDRTQVADLDPSMFLEIPDEEDDEQPCQACGEDDNEDVLMYCDGCEKLWHTYCTGLQEVPTGAWFCDNCRALRATRPQGRSAYGPRRPARRRTRGQARRQRSQQTVHDSEWNVVWHTVFTRLGMDLDFPHEDDDASATAMRRHRQQREASRQAHNAWQSRMRVAELAGAGNRFRETESAILNAARRRQPSPRPLIETPDEVQAWDAFEEARAGPNESNVNRDKKRKSRSNSASPSESKEETLPITVKRRRVSPVGSRLRNSEAAESSRTRPRLSPIPRRVPLDSATPSFLQSLLQEVEESSNTSNQLPLHRPSPRNPSSPGTEQHSPRPMSPILSPSASNHSSPRANSATPPPTGSGFRPSSPTGLSSSIQPVFPSAEYSPLRTNSPEPKLDSPQDQAVGSPSTRFPHSTHIAQPKPKSRTPRILDSSPPPTKRPRSTETSPTRPQLSLTAKSDVQKLVSAALKPLYNEQKISKDEYTMINRDISRMLYEKIGDFESLDLNGKAKWEQVAGEEVTKAVGALRAQA